MNHRTSGGASAPEDTHFVENQVKALLQTARQRIRDQIEKEKAVISLLGAKGCEAGALEDRVASIRDRIKQASTLNECVDRFNRFIEENERAFREVERHLRFPLGVLRHTRTEGSWDGDTALESAGSSSLPGDQPSGRGQLAQDAPNFVRLLERSKEVFQEATLCSESECIPRCRELAKMRDRIEDITQELAGVTEEVADLREAVAAKEREIAVRDDDARRMERECELWEQKIATDTSSLQLLEVKNREAWGESIQRELIDLECELQQVEGQRQSIQSKIRKTKEFKHNTEEALSACRAEIAALEASKVEPPTEAETDSLFDGGKRGLERARLKAEYESLDETYRRKLTALHHIRAQLKRVDRETTESEKQKSEMTQELAEHEKEAARQQAEKGKLEKQLMDINKSQEKADAVKRELEAEVAYLLSLCPAQAEDSSRRFANSSVVTDSDLLARARDARRRLHFDSVQGGGPSNPNTRRFLSGDSRAANRA